MKFELSDIQFTYPWVLAALGIFTGLIPWYLFSNRKKAAAFFLPTALGPYPVFDFKIFLFHSLFFFRCFTMTLIIICLSGPKQVISNEYLTGQGIDIMFCNDISPSMEALDFPPNRMEAAKLIGTDFVRQRTGDRMGLVVFGSFSVTLCPLTTDTAALIAQFNSIKVGEYASEETHINPGIVTAISKLKNSTTKSKIIILLSDGVDREEKIITEAVIDIAKDYNVKIYTVGIGSEGPVPVLYRIKRGDTIVLETIIEREFGFDQGYLKKVARETGGQYFYANDKDGLISAYKAINELERSDIRKAAKSHTRDLRLYFLYSAFFILAMEMFIRYGIVRKFP